MAYIKKLVMNGFKSFGKKTEILFDTGINVIVGPNGSGKSNVSDALCFVLGRLSAKSMRASQAKNLIFMGSKYAKPAKEAVVELVFDNSDKSFGLDKDEVVLARVVRRNGQSIYKISGETKTRTEILEMLAQAGIDPYGFNLVLQGQIQSIVRMHPDERRKIIEEVAGISIYESRKERSLHELEKTEEKLKEIGAILRERTAYLRNLDKERTQALRFKELELTVKRAKASILTKKSEEKGKEVASIVKSIEEKMEQKTKKQEKSDRMQEEANAGSEKINHINKSIQQATGLEQTALRNQIGTLRAEIEGLKVRKETYEHRKAETQRRIEEMNKSFPELKAEIEGLKKQSPMMAKKAQELKKKREEMAGIEEERKRFLTLKTELNSLKERIKDKERQLARVIAESETNLRNLEEYSLNLKYPNEGECARALEEIKAGMTNSRNKVNELNKRELEQEKIVSVSEMEITRAEEVKAKVGKIDVCPLCQSKITPGHVKHVFEDSDSKIRAAKESLDKTAHELDAIRAMRRKLIEEIKILEERRSSAEMELVRQKTIHERKEYLKKLVSDEGTVKQEIQALEDRRKNLEAKSADLPKIEEKYDSIILEIEEISSRTEEDIDTALLYKEREMENISNVVKRSKKDLEDIEGEITDLSEVLGEKGENLKKKEAMEQELNARFKRFFEERDKLQKEMQEKALEISEMQNEIRQIEDQINYLRIGKAKMDAEKEAVDLELGEYPGIELIQGSLNYLEERLKKAHEALQGIGSINMRSLEVYEEVKKEYDAVQDKVNTLEKEKQEIMQIIEEIDKKKRHSFMKTFRAINELFTSNFSKLYTKGIAYLEIENKEDLFAGGVNIAVKLAKGKYFDVTSLSGGEQTLVALSLLFAIQEHKPYHFYVFDEIDAALDKRNSERLSALLEQYMKSGQYIVITHNDAIITNSNLLYGVSMHEGISKILSLKLT